MNGLEFNDQIFEEYLNKIGFGISDLIDKNKTPIIFQKIYSDYLAESIGFDFFSSLCEKLWTKTGGVDLKDTELETVLNYGAELSWYIRNDEDTAIKFLKLIKEYYDRIKSP